MYPIHIGDPRDFAIVRELLVRANFTEPTIAARLGARILTTQTIDASGHSPEMPADVLYLLTRLFVLNTYVDEQFVRDHLSGAEIEALDRLGLIARELDNRSWYSPVCLCPVRNVYTVSDRWKTPDGKPVAASEDIVYPSVVPNTRLFLDILPDSPCESFLDVCSGTGVAALIAASNYAAQSYAYDIAPRSTHFAEFAKLLNGLANMTTGTGDLYEPAGDATFDRMVSHPPYVPVLESKWIFLDGGDDGERVTRRIIEQAPRFLRPGGTLYCIAMVSERVNQPLEARIREWLGSEERQFDVAIVVRREIEPQEFAFESLVRGEDSAGSARKWKELFDARHIISFCYAMMMVQRKAVGRLPFTTRRRAGQKTARLEHQFLLDSDTRAASFPDAVLGLELLLSPYCELRTLSRVTNEGWVPRDYRLGIDHPFAVEMTIEPWVAYLLARCDGTKTGAELFDDLKSEGVIHGDTLITSFIQVLNTLTSGGFLLTPGNYASGSRITNSIFGVGKSPGT